MRPELPSTTILGVDIAVLDSSAALAQLQRLLAEPEPAVVAFANAHTVNTAHTDPEFRAVLRRADLVLNDGAGIALAARLHGLRFPANLNGTDFTPRVLAVAARLGAPVFLLGGHPGVAAAAAQRLTASIPGLAIVGTADGYADVASGPELLATIRACGARLLVVGMGNPRQEFWLAEHLADSGASVGLAVGAFLDFAAARVRRAPAWMRAARIEWIFRLLQEPRRLFRRYITGNPVFLARVLRERVRRAG